MKNKPFDMEDVRSITVEVDDLIEKRLKEFQIKLSDEQEDVINNAIFETLESVSSGNYRHHN